jgi:hypothetical protein
MKFEIGQDEVNNLIFIIVECKMIGGDILGIIET